MKNDIKKLVSKTQVVKRYSYTFFGVAYIFKHIVLLQR